MSGPKYDQGKNDAQNNKGAPDTNTWTHQEKNDYYTGRKDGQK